MDQRNHERIPLARIAAALRVGLRTARKVSTQHEAYFADGTVDPIALFEGMGLPPSCLQALRTNQPVLITAEELSLRLGLSARTIRNYAKGHNRPPRFPTLVKFSAHPLLFLADDVAIYDYGVPDLFWDQPDPHTVENSKTSLDQHPIHDHLSNELLEDLESIIPDAPKQKRVRKK